MFYLGLRKHMSTIGCANEFASGDLATCCTNSHGHGLSPTYGGTVSQISTKVLKCGCRSMPPCCKKDASSEMETSPPRGDSFSELISGMLVTWAPLAAAPLDRGSCAVSCISEWPARGWKVAEASSTSGLMCVCVATDLAHAC